MNMQDEYICLNGAIKAAQVLIVTMPGRVLYSRKTKMDNRTRKTFKNYTNTLLYIVSLVW